MNVLVSNLYSVDWNKGISDASVPALKEMLLTSVITELEFVI